MRTILVLVTALLMIISVEATAQGANPKENMTFINVESGVAKVSFKSTNVTQAIRLGVDKGIQARKTSQITYTEGTIDWNVLITYEEGIYFASFSDDPDDEKNFMSTKVASIRDHVYLMLVSY